MDSIVFLSEHSADFFVYIPLTVRSQSHSSAKKSLIEDKLICHPQTISIR